MVMPKKIVKHISLILLLASVGVHIEGLSVKRKAGHIILNTILERWSPRTMSGESLSQDELMSLFEAARWAPSSYNNQPWRYIYAEKSSDSWSKFFNFLVSQNQGWCKNAAALIVVISKDTFDFNGKPSRTHSFDTGASWENLAIQGNALGLVVHAMQGFDYDRVKKELNIPDGYTVEAMIAVGKPARGGDLESLQEMEEMTQRKPLSETVFKGTFVPKS